MLKYLFGTLTLVCVVSLGLFIDRQSTLFDRQDTGSHSVSLAGSSRPVFAQGRIEGGTEEIELRPRLQGRLIELAVGEGAHVEAGSLLLRIDDQQYRHEVELAEAEVELAAAQLQKVINGAREEERREAQAQYEAKQAEFTRAERRWQREKKLVAGGATTQQSFDDQSSAVATLRAEVEAAKARVDLLNAPARRDEVSIAEARLASARAGLDVARVQLERTALVAPIAGRVLQVNVEPGELVGPDSDEPAIVMADTSRYRVRALVEELDAPRVQVGMTATVTADGLPGKTFTGDVISLSPRMSSKKIWSDDPTERFDTKVREVWIQLGPDTGELVVGLRVDVVIHVEKKGGGSIRVTRSDALPGKYGS